MLEKTYQSQCLERQPNQNHNIKSMREKVKLIQYCSLKTNYFATRIVSNVLEKDVVNFEPLDGNEFGILINKFLQLW